MSGAGDGRRWSPRTVAAFELGFRPWMRRRLRAVHLAGLPSELPADRPLLLAANHTSWWDGFVLREVHRALRPLGPLYTLMGGAELRRFRVLRWLGALDVGPNSPRALLATLRFLRAERERRPDLSVATFPQGRLWPTARRPLGFDRGVAAVARLLAPATVLPVALHYELFASPVPSAFVSVGMPIDCPGTLDLSALEHAVAAELDRVVAFLVEHGEQAVQAWPGPAGRLPAPAPSAPNDPMFDALAQLARDERSLGGDDPRSRGGPSRGRRTRWIPES